MSYLESQLRADLSNSKRVLDIKWDVGDDEFVSGFKKINELVESLKINKRNTLKISLTFYDPWGFISLIIARV